MALRGLAIRSVTVFVRVVGQLPLLGATWLFMKTTLLTLTLSCFVNLCRVNVPLAPLVSILISAQLFVCMCRRLRLFVIVVMSCCPPALLGL